MPICIAGMHRTGSSMIARLLHLSGLYLGPEGDISLSAEDNPEGFWENLHFVKLNDDLLAALGGGWDVPPSMPDGWELSSKLLPLRTRAAELIQQFESHEPWGWKDPRSSLTLPFWKQLLPNLKVVICLRSPLEVVRSLHKRGYASNAFGFNLWSAYYTRLLAEVRPEDRVITHYESYFHDARAELRRVLDLVGMQYTEETIEQACATRSESLRHNRGSMQELLTAEVPDELLKLYFNLCAEAGPIYQQAMRQQLPQDEPPSAPATDAPEHVEELRVLRVQARLAEQTHAVAELQAQLARYQQIEQVLREKLKERDNALAQLRGEMVERLQTEATRHEQEIERARSQLAQRQQQIEKLEQNAVYGYYVLQELEAIKASASFQLVSRVLWPASQRFIPPPVRQRLKGTLRWLKRRFFRPPVDDQLRWGIATDLTKPLVVGKGNLLFLSGWCYHTQQTVRKLSILVDGKPHQVVNHSMARPDVLDAQTPQEDRNANSLMSGFWVALPFDEVGAPREVSLVMRAVLDDKRTSEASIGALALMPFIAEPVDLAVPGAQQADQPLVVICMTTYNPPLDLLIIQLDSIIRQTYTNWVCIVNDDCSDQDTFAEIQRITARDERFVVYQNRERLGVYHNFERALARVPAIADFVALADQDDDWYPEKLAACLAEFRDDTMLVYSDMDIVTREGQLLSHTYWTTRRNNYTDLEVLLFANTVTGAASMFRARLLPDLLPFPEPRGDIYHDHWIACAALVKGAIGYVDRPLYAYRQHSGNVIGHYVVPAYELGLRFSTLAKWAGFFLARADVASRLVHLRHIYFQFLMRIILTAQILRLRIKDAPAEKKAILDQFAGFERPFPGLLVQAFKYKMYDRPTLGHEMYCLRGVIGTWLYDQYYRAKRRRLAQQRQAVAGSAPAVLGAPANATPPIDISGPIEFIPSKIAPLKLVISEERECYVNILIPTVNFRYLFAGYMGMFSFALHLKRRGYNVRVVIVDPCDFNPAAWKQESAKYQGLSDLFDQVEIIYVNDRSVAVYVSPNDGFVATSWWTAHIAHRAVQELGQEKFVFLAQEYEPMFYPTSSLYALSEEAYTFPHYAVFSTELLREYFRQNRIGVFRHGIESGDADSTAIENAINSFHISVPELRSRKRRKLLFYARPEQHAARNMFEMGVLALRAVLKAGAFDLDMWEFHGMGAVNAYKNVPLHEHVELKLMPRVSMEEYLSTLPSYDLGLSLMLTPHPSMVPLDMAAAGLVTVTNTYANKTAEALRAISSNIIPVAPTIEGIAEGLIAAIGAVDDCEKRVAGSQVRWSTSWDETFSGDVMARIEEFIELIQHQHV